MGFIIFGFLGMWVTAGLTGALHGLGSIFQPYGFSQMIFPAFRTRVVVSQHHRTIQCGRVLFYLQKPQPVFRIFPLRSTWNFAVPMKLRVLLSWTFRFSFLLQSKKWNLWFTNDHIPNIWICFPFFSPCWFRQPDPVLFFISCLPWQQIFLDSIDCY